MKTSLLAIALLPVVLFSSVATWAAQPNVILVITDDQGYGDLSIHGNPLLKTPNLDALHAESIRLTNFHVDPTCSPTRSALMTGRYSTKTGVWHTICGRSLLAPEEVTLAEVFKANGYRTGMMGKWHLGDAYPLRPQDQGFDVAVYHGGGGVGQTPDYWGNDYFDDTYWRNGKTEHMPGYCTDVWFREAIEFIDEQDSRPFFLYLSTNAPHGPYLVDEKYSQPFLADTDATTAAFLGMIVNIDENMGRLVQHLQAKHLEENTVLIFMTDNGTARGHQVFNAGMRGSKGSEYDGGHRVPCFVRWPGGNLSGGRDVDQLTAHIDVLPTLADLCQLRLPDGSPGLDGASLQSILRGEPSALRDRTLLVHSQRILHPEKQRKFAVMTDRWRLVNGRELYDMKQDPSQKDDLAAEHPGVVSELQGAYESWWSQLLPSITRTVHVTVGSDQQPRTRLTAHDWLFDGQTPWHQNAIRKGTLSNGSWAIHVATSGTYQITLSRWPDHLKQPIEARRVSMAIQGERAEKTVDPSTSSVSFSVPLKAGQTRLQTTLELPNGQTRGAYYAYIEKVD